MENNAAEKAVKNKVKIIAEKYKLIIFNFLLDYLLQYYFLKRFIYFQTDLF